VEQFVAGREINVTLVEWDGDVHPLPLAEIDFSAFPPGKPRIVDYAAKWLADSFEFQHTPRRIPAAVDETTAAAIRRLALAAWRAVGCRDYARVDLRLDAEGRPFVLEVNPNPDISPDAGFAAALAAAGIPWVEFVRKMVENAAGRRAESVAPQRPRPGARVSRGGEIHIRWSLPSDRDAILSFMADTGFFRSDEMEVAREVLDDALARGPAGHYQSYTAEIDGRPVGWTCIGPTPCTMATFDVYWIAVAPDCQDRHFGSTMLQHAERVIAEAGGRIVVVDTSGRPQYLPTRIFYERQGYSVGAVLATSTRLATTRSCTSSDWAVERCPPGSPLFHPHRGGICRLEQALRSLRRQPASGKVGKREVEQFLTHRDVHKPNMRLQPTGMNESVAEHLDLSVFEER